VFPFDLNLSCVMSEYPGKAATDSEENQIDKAAEQFPEIK
jgi:hypothetical protein